MSIPRTGRGMFALFFGVCPALCDFDCAGKAIGDGLLWQGVPAFYIPFAIVLEHNLVLAIVLVDHKGPFLEIVRAECLLNPLGLDVRAG